MKKNEFKCPHCSIPTVTTNTRHYDSMTLRRKMCNQCETMYIVLYKNDEIQVAGSYKPKERFRLTDYMEV